MLKKLAILMMLTVLLMPINTQATATHNKIDARLHARNTVISVGSDMVVDLIVDEEHVQQWQAEWKWQNPLRVMHVGYGELSRPYVTIYFQSRQITMRQDYSSQVTLGDSLLASLRMRGASLGEATVMVKLNIDGQEQQLEQTFYVVQCAGDLNNDGERDIDDIMIALYALDCEVGEECYSPLIDMTGTGIITKRDIQIVEGYWMIPCP